uniref:NEUR3 protein n=1 Tax=Macrostomum lignano TaxID=282301 RepID=A0A1I8I0C1_9PLAT
ELQKLPVLLRASSRGRIGTDRRDACYACEVGCQRAEAAARGSHSVYFAEASAGTGCLWLVARVPEDGHGDFAHGTVLCDDAHFGGPAEWMVCRPLLAAAAEARLSVEALERTASMLGGGTRRRQRYLNDQRLNIDCNRLQQTECMYMYI